MGRENTDTTPPVKINGAKVRALAATISKVVRFGFLSQGFGIRARRRRFRSEWNSHFTRCTAVQNHWFARLHQEPAVSSLVVLGAGRLFDLARGRELDKFRQVHLVDMDLGCLPTWLRFKASSKSHVSWEFLDVTGGLETLRTAFDTRISTHSRPEWGAAMEHLRNLIDGPLPMPELGIEPSAAILSLNILSQLVLPWRDFIHSRLVRSFGAEAVAEKETEWLDALQPTATALIDNHLRFLRRADPAALLMIADLEYAWATGPTDGTFTPRWEPGEQKSPYHYGPSGTWQIEGATLKERADPYFGYAPLSETVIARLFPGYAAHFSEPWVWMVDPKSGQFNLVGANTLRRSDHAKVISLLDSAGRAWQSET